jgi:[acyl-carrier-protein] S-malonyltransferase
MSLVLLCPGQGGQHPDMFKRVRGNPQAQPVLDLASALLGAPVEPLAADPSRFHNAGTLGGAADAAAAHHRRRRLQRRRAGRARGGGQRRHGHLSGPVARACPVDGRCSAGRRRPAGGDRAGRTSHRTSVRDARGVPGHRQWARPRGPRRPAACAGGARTVPLPVDVPAHTPLLAAAAQGFEKPLRALPLHAPRLRLLAGIDGRLVSDVSRVVATLSAQIAQPVQWQDVLQQAVERGGRVFLELGPGAALSRRVRDLHPQQEARSVEDFQTLEGVLEWVDRACARA